MNRGHMASLQHQIPQAGTRHQRWCDQVMGKAPFTGIADGMPGRDEKARGQFAEPYLVSVTLCLHHTAHSGCCTAVCLDYVPAHYAPQRLGAGTIRQRHKAVTMHASKFVEWATSAKKIVTLISHICIG